MIATPADVEPKLAVSAPPGPLRFQATAWEYVAVAVPAFLLLFVPIFGWAGNWLLINRFIINHLSIGDRQLTYTMRYGFALKVILRHLLLLVLTLGLGTFWLHVREITAVYAHAQFADGPEGGRQPVAPVQVDAAHG
ncbi:MAG: DUF898 family protein [Microthrixaceae bacterium]